jgi:hypothetical protein
MDNTTSSQNIANGRTAAPVTPFPAGDGNGGSTSSAAANTNGDAAASNTPPADTADAAAAAAPIVDRLIKRATSSAHSAVDSVAAKVTSLTGGLQDGVSRAGDTRDEWLESARDAIREHPFAAVAGALVIGAALLSLNSSRRN